MVEETNNNNNNNEVAIKEKYNLGDNCWIFTESVNENGEPITIKSEGKVVHIFKLDWMTVEHYVIQLNDPLSMQLEVRDALLMTDQEDNLIPVFQQLSLKE